MSRGINEAGNIYSRLTVIKEAGRDRGRILWSCKCKCGKKCKVLGVRLRNGWTKSCGCLQIEAVKKNATHGASKTKEFRTWCSIRRRCRDFGYKDYKHYGGRGLKVCKRWENFENFLKDIGPSPSKKHCIERINNNKGYSPSNCKWALQLDQNNNKRNSYFIKFNGQTLTAAQWARKLGISSATIRARISNGWSIKNALTVS